MGRKVPSGWVIGLFFSPPLPLSPHYHLIVLIIIISDFISQPSSSLRLPDSRHTRLPDISPARFSLKVPSPLPPNTGSLPVGLSQRPLLREGCPVHPPSPSLSLLYSSLHLAPPILLCMYLISYLFILYPRTGVPNPGPQPARNRAAQQEVSGRQVSK